MLIFWHVKKGMDKYTVEKRLAGADAPAGL